VKPTAVIAIWLGLNIAGYQASASQAPDASGIYYSDPGRTVYESLVPDPGSKDDVWWLNGNVAPSRPVTKEQKGLFFDEFLSNPAHDCSDTEYLCVFFVYRVFSVPREGLTPQSIYTAAGASLRVERCLRGNAKHCQVALVSSDCEMESPPDKCMVVEGGRTKSSAPGPVLYFIYNEDYGVTAYGTAKKPVSSADAGLNVAAEMVLRGKKGLLGKSVP